MTPQPCIFSPGVSVNKRRSIPAYLKDLAVSFPCTDGQAGYPTLTESKAGNNATIYSASSSDTYPGVQIYPYFDGINDYADAGNITEANNINNMAICCWVKEQAGATAPTFVGKWNSGTDGRQILLYRSGTIYRFMISKNGNNQNSIAAYDHGSVITGRDLFVCGVYHYDEDGTSEMRLYMNATAPETLSLVATLSTAVGPIYTSTINFTLGGRFSGGNPAGFLKGDLKKAELFNVDASRIGCWLDGTNPQARFAAGSGQ